MKQYLVSGRDDSKYTTKSLDKLRKLVRKMFKVKVEECEK